jgi:SAM-dependent methyltransferase
MIVNAQAGEKSILSDEVSHTSNFQSFLMYRFTSYEEFTKVRRSATDIQRFQGNIQSKLLQQIKSDSSQKDYITLKGYCYPSQQQSTFNLRYRQLGKNGENIKFNWREGLISASSGFNCRTRACIHLLDLECSPSKDSKIYMPEQVTSLYKYMKKKFPNTVGSEYLGNEIPLGQSRKDGVRNEDMTNLSFKDNELDIILSLEVFEHIPNYKKAFEECFRVLGNQGKMLFTVPFNYKKEHTIRAILNEGGTVTHLLEPEYHGNPVDKEGGCLCFQTFGWQLLEDLRSVGFSDVFALAYWSDYYMYLGEWQLLFLARK